MAVGLILVAGTGMAGAAARQTLAAQYPAPGELTDVGGHALHLHCLGQGPGTVVLEAGLGDFSVFWARVQPEVASFARVCAYDRGGLATTAYFDAVTAEAETLYGSPGDPPTALGDLPLIALSRGRIPCRAFLKVSTGVSSRPGGTCRSNWQGCRPTVT